ncbi:MAG: hypothetical protein CMM94_03975 [Rickettsiales bacterium]|nr:hypothetical protein [Rickettsiales bacterium]
MAKLKHIIACFMLCVFAVQALPAVAHAQTEPQVAEGDTETRKCIHEPGSEQLIERIVNCVHSTVDMVVERYFDTLYVYLENSIKAAITFAVILYGVLLAAGAVENVGRDTFIFGLKIAFVIGLIDQTPWIYEQVSDMLNGLTYLVADYAELPVNARCPDATNLWQRLDCIMGFTVGTGMDMSGLQSLGKGLVNFMFSSAGAGMLGFFIFIIGFYVIFTLIFAVARVIQTYLAALVGIGFMMAFAPLFIPMILFKFTKEIFDKWARIIIAFILQPVILFAYLALMIMAFDMMLFTGENSYLRTIAGNDAKSSSFDLNGWIEANDGFKEENVGFEIDLRTSVDRSGLSLEETGGMFGDRIQGFVGDSVKLDGDVLSVELPYRAVDYTKLGQARNPAQDGNVLAQNVTSSSIMLALASFLFISMLNYIPNLAHDLSGGVYETPGLYQGVGSQLPGQEQLTQMGSEASYATRSGINNMLNRGGG